MRPVFLSEAIDTCNTAVDDRGVGRYQVMEFDVEYLTRLSGNRLEVKKL